MNKDRFLQELKHYGNDSFDCGAWDDDEEPYESVYSRCEASRGRVLAALDELLIEAKAEAKQLIEQLKEER